MGWKPEHGGIKEILETKEFPTCHCYGNRYSEALDTVITGPGHRREVLRQIKAEEVGDRVHGGRAEVREPKGTLTFCMDDKPSV